MLEIIVNGTKEMTGAVNLADYIRTRVDADEQFAVAVNESFVAKSNYVELQLRNGDRIELVTPMAGG